MSLRTQCHLVKRLAPHTRRGRCPHRPERQRYKTAMLNGEHRRHALFPLLHGGGAHRSGRGWRGPSVTIFCVWMTGIFSDIPLISQQTNLLSKLVPSTPGLRATPSTQEGEGGFFPPASQYYSPCRFHIITPRDDVGIVPYGQRSVQIPICRLSYSRS